MPDGTPVSVKRPVLPLTVAGLGLQINGNRLIHDLHLRLEAGPRTVVMGPNGAGKSLLLRLLHGLIRPTAGSIDWNGRPGDRRARLRQAMVFQTPVLLRRSVGANMRYAISLRGLKGRALAERAEVWLRRADLLDLARRPARALSGGEQQRLAVARALSTGPDVLFLDEPTASLDPASVLAIEGLIAGAHAAGTKIVLITHDLGQARRLADEVVFLYRGQVAETGPAESFFDSPRSDPARAFLEGRIVL